VEKNMKKIICSLITLSGLMLGTSAFAEHSERSERKESLKAFEFAFGASLPVSRAYQKKDPHYTFGIGYIWDVDVAFIEARADHYNRFSGSPSQHYTSFTAGGNFIFLDQHLWALFAGLNLGLGFAKVQDVDMKGGFHIGADLGALFLRDADVNLDTRLRLAYNTANMGSSHPVFIGFLVGIHF
jgi:hypothetical protein